MNKNIQWAIVVHWDDENQSPSIGPFGWTEAGSLMAAAKILYQNAGLEPPEMELHMLRSGDNFIPMIMNSVASRSEVTESG